MDSKILSKRWSKYVFEVVQVYIYFLHLKILSVLGLRKVKLGTFLSKTIKLHKRSVCFILDLKPFASHKKDCNFSSIAPV